MENRREFLKRAGAAAIGATIAPGVAHGHAGSATPGDGPGKDLLMTVLQAARDAGASYADARLGRYRSQSIATRERQVTGVRDAESFGIGVRVLVNGSWGFAATRDLSTTSVQATARDAAQIARAAVAVQKRPVVLAPVTPVTGTWQSPIETDPFDVRSKRRSRCCSRPTSGARRKGRALRELDVLLREDKTFADDRRQLHGADPIASARFTATAVATADFRAARRTRSRRAAAGGIHDWLDLVGRAGMGNECGGETVGEAVTSAPSISYSIRPICGSPSTERRPPHGARSRMGYEANYAGTSFVAPPEEDSASSGTAATS